MKTPYIQKVKKIYRPTQTDIVKIIRWIWMEKYGKMLRDYAIDKYELDYKVTFDEETKDTTVALSIDAEINYIGYHIECNLVNDDRHTFIQNVVIAKTHGIRKWKYVGVN